MDIKKGSKTSEFYVVVVIIAVWVCDYLGIPIKEIANQMLSVEPTSIDIAKDLQGVNSSYGPWLGALYFIGRNAQKILTIRKVADETTT